MRYLTDRKRAIGIGSARSGTAHIWAMKLSSVALLLLIPVFVFQFGSMLGRPHAEVIAYFSRPFPAIVVGLTFVVGFIHFKDGVQEMLLDYVHGLPQQILIVAMILLSWAAAATGLFAIVRIAL